MHNTSGKSPKPFIWCEIRAGDICHNNQLYQRSTFESSDRKSHESKVTSEHPGKAVAQHPWGAALGALDLIADVSFSGALMGFCFYLPA